MDSSQTRWMRLLINGKAAQDLTLRQAVAATRDQGHRVEVRVTWEAGDAARYAAEAKSEGVQIVVAAGGDGTINEAANGLLQHGPCIDTALAVVPYGTANDFATSIGVLTGDPLQALKLAAEGDVTPIDVGKVNDRIFVNVTSGGFGAEVTANTPPQMKKALGGAAYSLMGLVTAAKMNPYECRLTMLDGEIHEGLLLLMAVGNGRQCGGGYQVTPQALLDDGLLDLVVVHDIEIQQLGLVLSELSDLTAETNKFINYVQVPRFSLESNRPLQLNLDGEPYLNTSFTFELIAKALPFVLGPDAPVAS